ncbi:peptidoglycan-binding domain-containing protein [Bradyrhizobium sp.]|uniref:peptidoglycan-binding domain-containing protein n=1 Tax=Bradyrhizobium sp. TaxID=376 RepID=UPI002737496E|nr:peptidoglycan-binding domain-containing protein [Bradyrhizobium sp.]MDP3692883.1 peptidoglycan-binding domain-containing protein [Bradyrhizobium sp.]
MPRHTDNEDMPRRRRGARATVVKAEAERGLVMRILLHSPKDMVAGFLAFAAVSAIIANALFLQAGRHPSPMFGTVTKMAAAVSASSPLPRPRPVEAATRVADPEPKVIELRSADPKSDARSDAKSDSKNDPKSDPMTSLVKATAVQQPMPSNVARPPAPIPAAARNETVTYQTPAARRVAAVQRTLTEYGYGQLKPTGTLGSDTQAAIQKFERERKLPVTGQVSDRLVKELAVMIGRPVD